jgi:hypothetical protein
MGVFGGTYESAKTDERKEFNRMLSFVKKSREKIPTLLFIALIDFLDQVRTQFTLRINFGNKEFILLRLRNPEMLQHRVETFNKIFKLFFRSMIISCEEKNVWQEFVKL